MFNPLEKIKYDVNFDLVLKFLLYGKKSGIVGLRSFDGG